MSRGNERPWCAEHQAILVRMAADCKSAREIGRELGRSRMSVIGRARRTGVHLQLGTSDGADAFRKWQRENRGPFKPKAPRKHNRSKPKPPPLVKSEPEKVVAPAPIAVEPVKPAPFWRRWLARAKGALFPMQPQLDLASEPEGVLWLTATRRQCQAIPGDPKSGSIDELRCCGKPTVDGKPYCIEHMMAFYIPEPPRKNITPLRRAA